MPPPKKQTCWFLCNTKKPSIWDPSVHKNGFQPHPQTKASKITKFTVIFMKFSNSFIIDMP